jgi:hypothetical protein
MSPSLWKAAICTLRCEALATRCSERHALLPRRRPGQPIAARSRTSHHHCSAARSRSALSVMSHPDAHEKQLQNFISRIGGTSRELSYVSRLKTAARIGLFACPVWLHARFGWRENPCWPLAHSGKPHRLWARDRGGRHRPDLVCSRRWRPLRDITALTVGVPRCRPREYSCQWFWRISALSCWASASWSSRMMMRQVASRGVPWSRSSRARAARRSW